MEPNPMWSAIATASQFPVPADFNDRLTTYRDWLATEASMAGGIGPDEVARLDTRHIGDSLLFALELEPVETILDIGTGVGLPGIPLAILLPSTRFVLLDRSGRRCDLVKRVIRVLDLENVEVVHRSVRDQIDRFPAVVTRATLPPKDLVEPLRRLLLPGGLAVVGGSWVRPPAEHGYITKEIGAAILDHEVWILIMRQT